MVQLAAAATRCCLGRELTRVNGLTGGKRLLAFFFVVKRFFLFLRLGGAVSCTRLPSDMPAVVLNLLRSGFETVAEFALLV